MMKTISRQGTTHMKPLNTTHETPAVDRRGFAMVTTLLVVLVLSVLAVGVAWLATSEKKITFAESVHQRSVFAADAGGESGINFIRVADTPPQVLDFATMEVNNVGETVLSGSSTYSYAASFMGKRPKPGWGIDYLDYDYQVDSSGAASHNGTAAVNLVCSRLFKEGY